jgi:hypothetical protein
MKGCDWTEVESKEASFDSRTALTPIEAYTRK